MITDRVARHEVLLPINHKYYNFREKKSSQDMKERGNLHKIPTKGYVNIHYAPYWQFGAKNTKASVRTRARSHNFECHWLIQITTLNVFGLLNCPIINCSITTWQAN